MFLAPQQIINRIKDCTYLAAALSDHNPIKMTLLIVQPSPQRWRFKTFMLKDPKFITYMNAQIDLFLETNVNSASNSIMWDALKVFMRGCILSYSTYKSKERRKELTKLDEEIRLLEQKYSETKRLDILNYLTVKRIQYNNLCTTKAEAALARTSYHCYQYGNKTGKLLAWQIKKEDSDKIVHSIITDDGRSLTESLEINAEFQNFYETLYKSEYNTNNIAAERFLERLDLPQINTADKSWLEADTTEVEVLLAMKSLQNNKARPFQVGCCHHLQTWSRKLWIIRLCLAL